MKSEVQGAHGDVIEIHWQVEGFRRACSKVSIVKVCDLVYKDQKGIWSTLDREWVITNMLKPSEMICSSG